MTEAILWPPQLPQPHSRRGATRRGSQVLGTEEMEYSMERTIPARAPGCQGLSGTPGCHDFYGETGGRPGGSRATVSTAARHQLIRGLVRSRGLCRARGFSPQLSHPLSSSLSLIRVTCQGPSSPAPASLDLKFSVKKSSGNGRHQRHL